ncbi:YonK family protein [Bacillus thuringiensis]|uniref:YonK family protein n=1 Tax=Bacillus thuringiensis TaxID=1428 RepID=UPI0026E36DD4|nr:YonK family protein [Bacillus thuringiensis]MDO6628691.1 YonK family protein [Bacillus thuringiensis]MDO6659184.1 YonK family protein [Bacillus thuringiensis]MDO6698766.1 YonK family protein [Bacillus thuringiensis]
MAKEVHSISAKGVLDAANNTITEYSAKGEYLGELNIAEALEKFDGKIISFAIKHDKDLNMDEEETY